MKKYKALIFDLDGTTLNTDLYVVLNYAYLFTKYQPTSIPPLNELVYFSGPPIREVFKKYFPGIDEDLLVKEFMEFGKNNMLNYASLYQDEIEVLTKLVQEGYKLGIVTNKSEEMTRKCLEKFNLTKFFTSIYTYEKCIRVKPDPYGLLECMKELGVKKEETIYIGDSEGDIETGKNADVDQALVTWSLKKDIGKIESTMKFSSFKDIERRFIIHE